MRGDVAPSAAVAPIPPSISNVVPLMCDLYLAEMQQQIVSVFGTSLPGNLIFEFGTIPARPVQPNTNIYFVPKLSSIPLNFIRHDQQVR